MSTGQPTVQIITDSTADIPEDRLAGLPVTVVPLSVEIEGSTYRDNIDLTREDFVRHLRAGILPRTSQPSIGTFQESFTKALEHAQELVSVHIAHQLSGTHNAAQQAARMVDEQRIHIIDAGTVSMGVGFLAIEAAEMAKNGESAAQIVQYLESRKHDQRLYATLETLEYLQKGGRIGRAAAMLGSALQLKPIVQVRGGAVEPVERVRTYRRALDRLRGIAEELAPFDRLAVLHLDAPNEAQRLVDSIQQIQPELDIVTGQIGTVIGTYGGPGLVGFTGLVERS